MNLAEASSSSRSSTPEDIKLEGSWSKTLATQTLLPPHIIPPPPPPPSRDICTSAAPLFIWITADVWTLGGIIRAGNMWRGEDGHHGLQSRLHYHFISVKRTLFNFTNQIFINRSAPSTSRIVPDNKTIFDIWCIDQDKAVLFAFYWS